MAVPKRQANPKSVIAAARTFFFTANAFEKRNVFQSNRMATLLIDVLAKNIELGRFSVHAFVVMPDHLHVLLTVTSDVTVEKAAQYIKGGFSFRGKRELGYKHELWQPGYSEEQVYTREHYDSVMRYIHENPVRRGLVIEAQQFPHSSLNSTCTIAPPPTHLRG